MVSGKAPLGLRVKTIQPLALHYALGQDTSGTLHGVLVSLSCLGLVMGWNLDSRTPSQGWGWGPHERRDLVGPTAERLKAARPSCNGKPSREAGEL